MIEITPMLLEAEAVPVCFVLHVTTFSKSGGITRPLKGIVQGLIPVISLESVRKSNGDTFNWVNQVW
jgi:hypothetical protein